MPLFLNGSYRDRHGAPVEIASRKGTHPSPARALAAIETSRCA